MPRVRFQFQQIPDSIGTCPPRPLVKVRLHAAPPGTGEWCLLDTGSPDTCLDWQAANRMGLNPDTGDEVRLPPGFAVGGVRAEEVRGFTLDGFIESDGRFVRLPASPVLFVRPWMHQGFTGIWGTNGMKSIRVEFSAGHGWFDVSGEV